VDVRARPGRRTVEERQQAVLELMAGKATVDQIERRRVGVVPQLLRRRRHLAIAHRLAQLVRIERAIEVRRRDVVALDRIFA
jgi:transposase-like protein